MCNKLVQHSLKDFGKTFKQKCSSPDFKDGLCKHHYKRQKEKKLNWEERSTYRNAEQADLDSGRSLKLKNTFSHKIYTCRNGIVKVFNAGENKFINTDILPDFNLFCVKK